MRRYGLPLTLLALASMPALANTDVYGRVITDGARLLPLDAPSAAPATIEGDPTFTLLPYTARATDSWPDGVVIGDVSGDGRNDVVMVTSYYFSPEADFHLFLFKQGSNGVLQAPESQPYGQKTDVPGIAIADLDGQHGLDIAVGGADGITPFLATAAGGLSPRPIVMSGPVNSIVPITLTATGRMDLLGTSYEAEGSFFYNNGAGGLTPAPWIAPNCCARGYAVGDLNNDGKEDLILSTRPVYPQAALVHPYLNEFDGAFTPLPTLSAVCGWLEISDMDIGDVTGDGIADIVTVGGGNRPNTCVQVFAGLEGGGFAAPTTYPTYDIPQTVVVTDINTDGRDDVVVLHGGWLALGVYLQGTEGFLGFETRYPIPYASSYQTNGLAVADFSGDGCPDAAIADYNHGLVTLEGRGCVGRIFEDGFE